MGYINSQIGETSRTTSETVGPPGPRGAIGPAGPQGPIGPRGEKVLEGRPVHKDPKGKMDRRVPKGWPVHRGETDRRVQKTTKVILGLRVVPAVPLILTCKISTRFFG